MKLLVYASPGLDASWELMQAVMRAARNVSIEWIQTFENLYERLHVPRGGVNIVVVLVRNHEELERLGTLRSFLDDVRAILVLPVMSEELVSLARGLFPRFLTDGSDGFRDIEAVLSRMLGSQAQGAEVRNETGEAPTPERGNSHQGFNQHTVLGRGASNESKPHSRPRIPRT